MKKLLNVLLFSFVLFAAFNLGAMHGDGELAIKSIMVLNGRYVDYGDDLPEQSIVTSIFYRDYDSLFDTLSKKSLEFSFSLKFGRDGGSIDSSCFGKSLIQYAYEVDESLVEKTIEFLLGACIKHNAGYEGLLNYIDNNMYILSKDGVLSPGIIFKLLRFDVGLYHGAILRLIRSKNFF